MSTQKLPSPFAECRANPRTRAIATAMPVAADIQLCEASATMLEK